MVTCWPTKPRPSPRSHRSWATATMSRPAARLGGFLFQRSSKVRRLNLQTVRRGGLGSRRYCRVHVCPSHYGLASHTVGGAGAPIPLQLSRRGRKRRTSERTAHDKAAGTFTTIQAATAAATAASVCFASGASLQKVSRQYLGAIELRVHGSLTAPRELCLVSFECRRRLGTLPSWCCSS